MLLNQIARVGARIKWEANNGDVLTGKFRELLRKLEESLKYKNYDCIVKLDECNDNKVVFAYYHCSQSHSDNPVWRVVVEGSLGYLFILKYYGPPNSWDLREFIGGDFAEHLAGPSVKSSLDWDVRCARAEYFS